MKQVRDCYQRKVHAVTRMNSAIIRVDKSKTEYQKEKAVAWVTAWAAISGLRQFKIIRKIRA
jgi:hypothetical protein